MNKFDVSQLLDTNAHHLRWMWNKHWDLWTSAWCHCQKGFSLLSLSQLKGPPGRPGPPGPPGPPGGPVSKKTSFLISAVQHHWSTTRTTQAHLRFKVAPVISSFVIASQRQCWENVAVWTNWQHPVVRICFNDFLAFSCVFNLETIALSCGDHHRKSCMKEHHMKAAAAALKPCKCSILTHLYSCVVKTQETHLLPIFCF